MMQSRLSHLETVIAQQRGSFHKIGKALKEIRDDRLYRQLLFTSFEAYLKDRWDMGRSQAYRLIEAVRVIDNLSPIGDILPENEAQLRPLVQLNPMDQRKTWLDFVATGKQLSARNIRRFVSGCPSRAQRNGPDLTEVISSDYEEAVMAMLEQIRLATQDGWHSTSRQAALLWNRVMKDRIVTKL
jgi:hypothetical protein